MNSISKNVIRDLLPLYLAGEASPETIALVKEFLSQDKELAEEARLAQDMRLPVSDPAPSAEKETLEKTRRLLKSRSATLAMALLFTVLPFSFVFEGRQVTFLMIRDAPVIGITWWATAAVMWICYAVIRYRLRVSNL
jgi:hypothetical protein